MDRSKKEDLLYDAKLAKDMVLEWKAHILRAQNQDQAKQDALRSLDNNTVLVIMDWAMKFVKKKNIMRNSLNGTASMA